MFLKESLGKVLDPLRWCDTRDMLPDGFTKDKVTRDLLVEAMKGKFEFKFESRVYDGVNVTNRAAGALALQPELESAPTHLLVEFGSIFLTALSAVAIWLLFFIWL